MFANILEFVFILSPVIQCKPILLNLMQKNQNFTLIVEYLLKYGYLRGAIQEMPELLNENDLTIAIKMVQRMGGIQQNGNFNDPDLQNLIRVVRCSNPDVVTSANGSRSFRFTGSMWHKRDLTFFVSSYVDAIALEVATQYNYIKKAFDMWARVADLNFFEASNVKDADVKISKVQDGLDVCCGRPITKTSEMAHAWGPGVPESGTIHINNKHFTSEKTMGYPKEKQEAGFLWTITHEMGHMLGLHHALSPSDLMYPVVMDKRSEKLSNIFLSTDDIDGIQTLYGPSQREDALKPEDQPPPFIDDGYETHTEKPTVAAYAPEPSDREPPTACDTSIDAVSVIDNKTYVFKRRWYWRFNYEEKLEGKPRKIFKFFRKFRPEETYFDAVVRNIYLPHKVDMLYIFIGDHFYRVNDFATDDTGIPLASKNINVPKIDAALSMPSIKKIFLFAGNEYWRLDSGYVDDVQPDEGYPKSLKVWEGIEVPINAAYSDKNGDVYFFKDKRFWKMFSRNLSVMPGYPKLIGKDWLSCDLEGTMNHTVGESSKKKGGGRGGGGSGGSGELGDTWVDGSPATDLSHIYVLSISISFFIFIS